jgi:hypothetical protein
MSGFNSLTYCHIHELFPHICRDVMAPCFFQAWKTRFNIGMAHFEKFCGEITSGPAKESPKCMWAPDLIKDYPSSTIYSAANLINFSASSWFTKVAQKAHAL